MIHQIGRIGAFAGILFFSWGASQPAQAAWPAGCYITASGDYICNNYTPPASPPPPPVTPPPPPPAATPTCGNVPDPLSITPGPGGMWIGNSSYGDNQDSGYTYGFNTAQSTSCLGFSGYIVDMVSKPGSTPGDWDHVALDPLPTGMVDLRYIRQPLIIFRFRTPPPDNYLHISHGYMNITPQIEYTAIGLSKTPCDTSTNLVGPPLSVPGRGGLNTGAGNFITKGDCPLCQTWGSNTIEANQIYYYTVLNANPQGPSDDGFIDAGDRVEWAVRTGYSGPPVCR